MSKLRTINQLQDQLDKEYGWRLKELANLKLLMKRKDFTEKTAARAAICLAYSHWEGFIKCAAEHYLRFVSDQKLNYSQLASCFIAIGAKQHLNALISARSSSHGIAAVHFMRSLERRATICKPNTIVTESNLSSKVFESIACSIGIDPSPFTSRYNQIDTELLGRRNSIAHGEYIDLDTSSCSALVDDVIDMLKLFKDVIQNSASEKSFLSSQEAIPRD